MRRVLLAAIVTALAVYGVLCLAAFRWQHKLVYFPGRPGDVDPAALGMPFDELPLTAEDGVRLHAWWVRAASARGAVLILHGNAGTVAERLPLAQAFVAMGWSCLLLDYRGYGRSEGTPSEEGTYLDAVAAYDHATRAVGLDRTRIAVYGESLGGAVAIELARRRPVAACIVESAFTSLPAIGARAYPWLPVRWLARIRYDNLSKIGQLNAPVLVIHSPQDEVVPFAHGQALYAAARQPKRLLITAGGHNGGGFLERAEHRAAVRQFLEDPLAAAVPAPR